MHDLFCSFLHFNEEHSPDDPMVTTHHGASTACLRPQKTSVTDLGKSCLNHEVKHETVLAMKYLR